MHALNTESGGPVNHDSDLFTENFFFITISVSEPPQPPTE